MVGTIIVGVIRSQLIKWSARTVLTGAVSRGLLQKAVQEKIMKTLIWSLRGLLIYNVTKSVKHGFDKVSQSGENIVAEEYIPIIMEVLNDEEVKQSMKELSMTITDDMAYEALGEMCIYLVRQARLRTPVKSGKLRDSINYVIKRNYAHNELNSFVMPGSRRKVPYRSALEIGAKPHIIKPKNKQILVNKNTNTVYGTGVKHPGMTGYFYMARTKREELQNALQIYKDTINRRLQS